MGKTYETLTGAELLRADPHSQKIGIDVENTTKDLIQKHQFWGNETQTERLYFDYKDKCNNGWSVEQNGWNDYSQDQSRQLNPEDTDKWIDDKVFCNDRSTLSVIQGYAGCGKTIFVNSLLKKRLEKKVHISSNDIYVDYDNNAGDSGYLPSTIRNHVIIQLTDCLLQEDGLEIYNTFVSLFNEYCISSASLSDFLALFRKNGQISELVKEIYSNRENPNKIVLIKEQLTTQFISGTMAISGALKGKLFAEGNLNILDLISIDEQHIKALLESYLVIDLILLYAINLIRKQDVGIVFYDNLDIIDNPQHVAFFINKLQEVLFKIPNILHKNHDSVPIFNVILAVRKITYALVSSFMEVRDTERGIDVVHVNFLDISNLYSSTQLLKHKATILKENFNNFIPEEYHRTDVKEFLKALVDIPEAILDEICLSDLFNHNIRACANILERAMKNSSHIVPVGTSIEKMSDKCSGAIWIHSICSVLHDNNVWENMGYNTADSTTVCFPTTLSRMILTYLYNKRREFRNNSNNGGNTEVSFRDIIQVFERLPFFSFASNNKRMQMEAESHYSAEKTYEMVITVLSNMLKRNIASDGINPKYEMELWRRPIYFTKNAFSLTNEDGSDNVKKELTQQIKCFDDPNANITDFCITDEGYTFIEKIATSFEFYSVRYNGSFTKPLCYLTNVNKVDKVISNVYSKVEECIENHNWLMGFYVKNYGKSQNDPGNPDYKNDLNQYLSQMFHPRTETHKPQLHIVRTIYDHIYYLNDYRDYLIETHNAELNKLNKCLVGWIGKYLELYRKNLYELLDGTIGSFNGVFLDLKYLYWRVIETTDYLPCIDNRSKKISICKSNAWIRENSNIYITDERLITEPMLIDENLQ